MGTPANPQPVKLIVGMIAADPTRFTLAADRLTARYGPLDAWSDEFPFDFTRYYEAELGPGLRRRFVSFAELIEPGRLAEIKRVTNDLEQELAEVRDGETCRTINLDPGYLELSKLVLATTKNSAHRVYLGKGIYAEVTLQYRNQRFVPLPWTYADYRTADYHRFFLQVRRHYHEQLRERGS